jgi:outer membrane protein TolC
MAVRGRWLWLASVAAAGVLLVAVRPAASTAQSVLDERQGAPDSTVLTLSEAVSSAVAAHPAVGVARAEVDRAGAMVGEARSAYLPTLSAEGTLTRSEHPLVVAPLHGFNPQSPPAFADELVQGQLTASYTLFDGGARRARLRRANASEEAASQGLAAAEASLLGEVTRSYLEVVSTRELLLAHGRRVAALDRERERAERMLAEGRAARVLVLRAGAALSAARADSVGAALAADVAERELARLMGVEPERLIGRPLAPLGGPAPRPVREGGPERAVAPAPYGAGAPSAAQARAAALERARSASPELQRARSQLEAARAAHAEATAAWFPRFQLVGRYADYGTTAGGFQAEWQAGVQLSYPLFTAGARPAASERADAEVRAAAEQLRLAELRLAQAVDRAAAAVEAARARVAALEAAVQQGEEVVRIERLSLEEGAGVQSDYLTAEAELLRARAALTEARAQEIGARVELARVAGELTLDWLARNLERGQ